jgi:hypothetical protein
MFTQDSIDDLSSLHSSTQNETAWTDNICCTTSNSTTNPIFVPGPNVGYELFSKLELSCLRILIYCNHNGCSRLFYNELMTKIFQEVSSNKLDLLMKLPSRQTLLHKVFSKCPTPPPIEETIPLENVTYNNNADICNYVCGPPDFVELYRFDFSLQLMDLLANHAIFSSLDNLDVNRSTATSQFSKFQRNDNKVYEVNSGSWYQNAYNHLIKDPNNEFLLPLILYIDKTGTDALQRHSLEPITFTTSIINWKKRQTN